MTREEAIKVASETYGWLKTDREREALETLIPELKENEDERVEKLITDSVFYQYGAGAEYRDVLDYLGRHSSEKQKEQKEIFDADKFFAGKDVNDFKKELFLVIRGAREFKPTDEEIWHNIENQIAPCLVDILQEGVELAEPKFKIGDKVKLASEPKYPAREIVEIKDGAYYFDSAVHLPFAKQDEWELVEEKPSGWSEEDEEMLNSCISSIEESKENRYAYKETDGDTSYDREIAFMKSLPERFVLQPKQEWSEEDESNATFILESLDGLLRYCKKNKEGAHQSKQIKEAQEWIKTRLKSIEPQPETNDEEYIRNLENLESIVYYAKFLPDDTRTKLGNFLQSLRKNRKTCDVDEFSLTLKNCLSVDSELTDEQADTFARAYGEDLYKVALGEISTGLDKEDVDEYRMENGMGLKPGDKFWVRCKTEKSENLWFDKGDERPAYVTHGKGGIEYVVYLNKDGKGSSIFYPNKESLLETFEIIKKPQ